MIESTLDSPSLHKPVVVRPKQTLYIISDVGKKPRSFKIGIFTVYLVVTFLSLIQSAFQMSSLIFIKLSESTVGDTDMIISPISAINDTSLASQQIQFGPNITVNQTSQLQDFFSKLINTTQVEKVIKNMDSVYGQSPRWVVIGDLSPPKSFKNAGAINQQLRAFAVIIDSIHELSIGIGRNLNVPPLYNDEAYISQTTLQGLGLKVGDPIDMNIDLQNIIGITGNSVKFNNILFYEFFKKIIKEQQKNQSINSINQILISQLNLNLNIDEFNSNDLKKLLNSSIIDSFLPENQTISIQNISATIADYILQSLNITIHLKVQTSVNSAKGKWPDSFGNVIAVDYRNITNIITEAFMMKLNQTINDNLNNMTSIIQFIIPQINILDQFNLTDYSLSSNFVINNRVKVYSSTTSIKSSIINNSNQFYQLIGKDYPTQISTPLADSVQQFLLVSNFLDQLVVSTTFLLLLLSILLIYSLMIGDVEEKTYEFGMLRALGFGKVMLVVLLTFQALIFAIPGLVLGLITSYLLNTLVGMIIFGSSTMITSYQLNNSAIYLGVSIGMFIPLISNILPIQRALSKSLRDSLDLYHRSVNQILVHVVKLEKMGISLAQSLTAFLMLFMGFICYYLAPQAFIFQNIPLFLTILNMTLIILIIGATLIANLIQSPLQRLIINIVLRIRPNDKVLLPIVLKNLEAHQGRNSKTTLMYTLALSFLIFSGTGFDLQSTVITDLLQSAIGANIVLLAPVNDKTGLDEKSIRQFMSDLSIQDPTLIQGYSFTTYSIDELPTFGKAWIQPLSEFPFCKTKVIGVEQNLLQSLYIQYYIPNSYDQSIKYPLLSNGKKDGVYGLYSRIGDIDLPVNGDKYDIITNSEIRKKFQNNIKFGFNSISYDQVDREVNMIVPQGLGASCALSIQTPSLLQIQDQIYRVRIRQLATKIPGFLFSSYGYIANTGHSIVSMDDYIYMVDEYLGGSIQNSESPKVQQFAQQLPAGLSNGVPKAQFFAQFARSTTQEERTNFCNGLRNYIKNDQTQLFDVISLVETAQSSFFYISLFYIIVAIVSIVLSFFLLLVSFISNIRENSWEFGILRSIGLNKGQLTRIYIYESLGLILASGLIGTIVGILIAIALTIQMGIFTELPFVFLFPTIIFFLTFVGGLFTAVMSSYLAVKEIRDKPISLILKGLN